MRRVAPMLAAIVAVALGGALMMGGLQVSPLFLVVPVAIGMVVWARHSSRAGGIELRWMGRATVATVPTVAIVSDRSSHPATVVPPAGATRRQVVAALARFESRQWLSSPWFGAGVGFCLLLVFLFGWAWAADYDGAWREWFILMPVMAHPMVGMAVVGAHQAVTRSRRDGAEEMFASCPADESIRTAGQLGASWVPIAVVAGFAVGASALLAVRNPRIYGPIDGRAVADVLAALVLTLGGSALGVALARWAPWRLAPIVAVTALVPLITSLGNIGEPHWSNARQLSSWPRYPDHELLFTDPTEWWHLLWLGALAALMLWIAFVHANRSRPMVVAGVTVTLIAAGVGIAATRPLSASAASRLASMVAEPAEHQTCRSTPHVEVCVYEGYADYIDPVLANVAPVAAAVAGSPDSVTFRQTFDGDLDVLGPEVATALGSRTIPVGGFLPLGYLNPEEAMNVARLTMALDAVGLPTGVRPSGVPTVIAGEARGVVALWLAARGLDPDDAYALASHHFDPDDHSGSPAPTALDLGMAWPDPCSGGLSPPVAWAAQDLAASRELLELPADEVHTLLTENWERFTDRATSTDELLTAAGLDPVGPPDRILSTSVVCEW